MSQTLQDQNLTTISFNAGVVKEQTRKTAESFWTDADKVRFRLGKPELLGGWQNVTTPEQTFDLLGTPRALETVRSIDGQRVAVIGTNIGLFASNLSRYYDISPRVTTVATSSAFSTSAGSTEVVVSVSAHGLETNTVVGFTSATTTIGGNIVINVSAAVTVAYQISVIDNNSFAIDVGTTAAATSAQTGGDFTAYLHYPAGPDANEIVNGWGTGVWNGNFGWGSPASGSSFVLPLRLWSLDLWGTEVMAVPTSGPLMLYQPQNGLDTPAVVVTAAPSVNQIVRVAPEARHVVLYGTHDLSGNYDPLLIRWCSSEDYTDWTPTLTNTAGDYRLPSRGSEIRNVTRMTDKTIILTDSDLFSQNYIGSNDVFGFVRGSENCGVISQNAAVEYNGVLYWMSNNGQFFKFDGRVQPLDCQVLRFIFDNLNTFQTDKICAGVNSRFNEIIWFYPEAGNSENNRYAIYNTAENHWTVGTLVRTAWKDSSTFSDPLATGSAGMGTYYHEVGYADDTQPMVAYLESGYFDLQSGNDILFANKVVPDFSNISNNDPFTGTLTLTLNARKYPDAPEITKGPYLIQSNTQKISTRLRGREFAIRFDSNVINVPWRLGEFRMAIEPDGNR
jgi:hypothetical protein